MVKKSAHPEQLFEYLNGAADAEAAQATETHLSACEDCASVAAVVRELKDAASQPESESRHPIVNLKSQVFEEHPDTGELASFFYAGAPRADSSRVAMHVALCSSCVDAIAQYAQAERASEAYKPGNTLASQVPAKAWELIREWEDSSFAKPKPASEVLGQEMLNRLYSLLDKHTQQVRELDHAVSGPQSAGRVPVHVVSSSGEVRSVEFFERVIDATGKGVLKHAEGSQRFDNRVVHALLDYGEKDPVVISELIESDTLRQQHAAAREEKTLRRVDYFIIEESRG
jgi:hypothetical protein